MQPGSPLPPLACTPAVVVPMSVITKVHNLADLINSKVSKEFAAFAELSRS